MRTCSRSVAESCAGGAVSCGCGNVRETFWSGVLLQPASSNANASAAPHALHADSDAARFTIILFYKLDLLGRFGHDDRAAAPFDPAAHADAAAFKLL